jgi:hypothetical protein
MLFVKKIRNKYHHGKPSISPVLVQEFWDSVFFFCSAAMPIKIANIPKTPGRVLIIVLSQLHTNDDTA